MKTVEPMRQKAVRIRRAPGNVQAEPYVVVTIPKWVNQTAAFQLGEQVVVVSRKPGEVTVRRVADLPKEQQDMHQAQALKLTDAQVARLKEAWEMGIQAPRVARKMEIAPSTAARYYGDFKAGRK